MMTRFARAKGSKASNERKEEDPTPWHIMRQQLEQQLNKNDSEKESSFVENTEKVVLKPEEEKWVEFNEFKFKKPSFMRDIKNKALKEFTKSKNENTGIKTINQIQVENNTNSDCLSEIKVSKSNTNSKPPKSLYTFEKGNSSESVFKKTVPKISKNIKSIEKNTSKQNKINTDISTIQSNKKTATVVEYKDVSFNNNVLINKNKQKQNTKTMKKELKNSDLKILEDTNTEQEQIRLSTVKTKKVDTSDKLNNPKHFATSTSKNSNKEMLSFQVANHKKIIKTEFQSHANKNSCSNVQTIIANDRQIEIVKFEAFWIKKEHASKLKNLKKKLKDQNMPNDKIKTIIKLERRKAEKALSREKIKVCYHCRKFGHKFSECPEINNLSISKSGICFKCGSTEHTHFECKVTHSQSFRYAVCFVCKEQGHIARQCSLNPQGQYPKGGSCHLCGEVTHLRKDCPKAFEEKSSEKMNIVELEDVSEMKTMIKKHNLVKTKIVVF